MPRITEERREARRTAIVDAARRRFARNGFHQTSMPELLAEAGISAGAFYRYFASKDELILAIAKDAFDGVRTVLARFLAENPAPSVGEIVTAVVSVLTSGSVDVDGRVIDLGDQMRCGVQAWAEMLRDDTLRRVAQAGTTRLRGELAEALARGQAAGRVPPGLEPEDGAQLVMTLLPGFILQRTVFGEDSDSFVRAVTTLLGPV